MANILASRAAGYKLGLALFLLLVPIGYFGAILTLDSLRKFNLAQANGAAVNLVDLTFRSMIDLTRGWSVSDKQNQLLVEGPALAKRLG